MAYAPEWVLAPTTLIRLTSPQPNTARLDASDAVKEGQLYALWHGFHQGPFAIVALERIAQWLYPERFYDLDPAATFDALLPTPSALSREGHFWGSLNAQ